MRKKHKKQIKKILKEFDFKKVSSIMRAVHWHWCGTGVPGEKELRDTARGLLEHIPEGGGFVSSGGFTAMRRGRKGAHFLCWGIDSLNIELD